MRRHGLSDMLLHACSAEARPDALAGSREGALCLLTSRGVEQMPALRVAADELQTLSRRPSAALHLAAELPSPVTRNYFGAKAYLPSSRYWHEVLVASGAHARIAASQQKRRERSRAALCSPSVADTSELRGLMGSAVGGVAKLLIYASESAVRLASLKVGQVATDDVGFPFAAGIRRCGRSGGFLCFFRPSLCGEQHVWRADGVDPEEMRHLVSHHPTDVELSWPLSLRRAMRRALALEAWLEHLQPHVETLVQQLLARVVHMDRHGARSSVDARRSARRPRAAAPGRSIGMHVRRGDACETQATHVVQGVTDLDAERRCYALDEYLRAAHSLQRLFGATHVFLVSDSEEVLMELQRHEAARNFTWEWLAIDRYRIGGSATQNLHVPAERRVLMEHRALRGDPANEQIVVSMLADLRLVANADMVVGTSRSFVTHAAQLLVWARSGILPPTISLEGDPIYTLLHVRGRFWKRTRVNGHWVGDRGWIPCVYARAQTPAGCFTCQNLTVGHAATCMDSSFSTRVLKKGQQSSCTHCLSMAHPVLE